MALNGPMISGLAYPWYDWYSSCQGASGSESIRLRYAYSTLSLLLSPSSGQSHLSLLSYPITLLFLWSRSETGSVSSQHGLHFPFCWRKIVWKYGYGGFFEGCSSYATGGSLHCTSTANPNVLSLNDLFLYEESSCDLSKKKISQLQGLKILLVCFCKTYCNNKNKRRRKGVRSKIPNLRVAHLSGELLFTGKT